MQNICLFHKLFVISLLKQLKLDKKIAEIHAYQNKEQQVDSIQAWYSKKKRGGGDLTFHFDMHYI